MNKIYIILGQTGSGKSTIFKEIKRLVDKTIPIYTTRPKRNKNDNDYIFIDENAIIDNVISDRSFNNWRYIVSGNDINLNESNYMLPGNSFLFKDLCEHYGKEKIVGVKINTNLAERIEKLFERELKNKNQDFKELMRRIISDKHDEIYLNDYNDVIHNNTLDIIEFDNNYQPDVIDDIANKINNNIINLFTKSILADFNIICE